MALGGSSWIHPKWTDGFAAFPKFCLSLFYTPPPPGKLSMFQILNRYTFACLMIDASIWNTHRMSFEFERVLVFGLYSVYVISK